MTHDDRTILHIDMDAYYASIEQRDDPSLKGKPVIIGGTGRRGVVSTASYEARKFGVRSAMPGFTARRLCPQGIFLRPRIGHYSAISRQVFEIFSRYTPLVEPLSLDEAFLDVTGSLRLFNSGREIGQAIQGSLVEETGLTASVGIAPTKFIAKIASDLKKPNGLVEIQPGEEEGFLAPLPIAKMWGIGPVAAKKLTSLGLVTFGDIAGANEKVLEKTLGKWGVRIRELAQGRDRRGVIPDHRALSIGCENTFGSDLTTTEDLADRLLAQVQTACRRMRKRGLQTERVTVKIKLAEKAKSGRFVMRTRSQALPYGTTDDGTVFESCKVLLLRGHSPGQPVRLTGVSLSHLTPEGSGQLHLFPRERGEREKSDRLTKAIDQITNRFGNRAIRRGK